jgi:hypothetical protein
MEREDFSPILMLFEGEQECPITSFITDLADEFMREDFKKELEYLKEITKGNERHVHVSDLLTDYGVTIVDIAVGVGFVLRDMFEIGKHRTEERSAIERIKNHLIEEKLLAYLPNLNPTMNPTNK